MALVPGVLGQESDEWEGFRHVLLVSIDGMDAVDYLNCSRGLAGVNGGNKIAGVEQRRRH
jgi:hypothetical protein